MGAKYRVAIIGTGRMGGLMEDEFPPGSQFHKPYGHFSAYQSIEETEVVAVANRGEERLKRFERRFGITNTYLDYREMIETEKPDIVSVTTASVHRAEPIIFCAEHGVRGIYSEKGLCASLAEADRIREAVTANNVAFNWGAMRRHHDGFKQLRAAIADGAIGDLLYGVMYSRTDIIKHHPHTVDLVSMMLGDPTPVWVEGRLAEPGEGDVPGSKPYPEYDAAGHRYLPPAGEELADPIVGFFPGRLRQRDGGDIRAAARQLRRGRAWHGRPGVCVGQRRRVRCAGSDQGRLRRLDAGIPARGRKPDGEHDPQHHPGAGDGRAHQREH